MQQSIELLVVTLAYTSPGRDTDAQAHLRLVVDTIRTTPGLTGSRLYRGRGHDPCYVLFSTWADEESWQKAQEHSSPKHLLLSKPELLVLPPEQWVMAYLWGYRRPAATPTTSAAHLATLRADQIEGAQRGWIRGLREQIQHPQLAFAFLARELGPGRSQDLIEEITKPRKAIRLSDRQRAESAETLSAHRNLVLLGFFSWGHEHEREAFYADPHYQTIKKQIESMGVMRILPLEEL